MLISFRSRRYFDVDDFKPFIRRIYFKINFKSNLKVINLDKYSQTMKSNHHSVLHT